MWAALRSAGADECVRRYVSVVVSAVFFPACVFLVSARGRGRPRHTGRRLLFTLG